MRCRTFLVLIRLRILRQSCTQLNFLIPLSPNGMPPHRLILKLDASIILFRSLDATQGLCNGTRLIIRSVTKCLIDTEVSTGSNVGNRVFIPRIPLLTPTDSGFPFILKRRQFPYQASLLHHYKQGPGSKFRNCWHFPTIS